MRIEWEGTEDQQQYERVKACRERCAQVGDDDCEGDGSCDDCAMDMAEALETPASRARRLAALADSGTAATIGQQGGGKE